MEITRDDLRQAIGDLKTDLKEDLQAISAHLATLNGRTGKGEIERENLRTRLVSVEKEMIRHPNRRRDDHGEGAAWATGSVSKREGALIGFGLVIITVLIKVLELVGTKLWHVLLSSKP